MKSSQENINLFVQIDRDIGTLIAMLFDCNLPASDRKSVTEIAIRMNRATDKLQEILYPESLEKK